MNYLRGAVNAISAPYQYYKELPPINPSTLTGAIDVIVIQRPTDNGGTELVCSPFHVRFGKWQVLRPGEKKVNVFVNGNPIPFNMKIGQAGEAFFVFETDEDVPPDLITSPILQPTIPGKEEVEEEPVDTNCFGAKEDGDKEQQKEDIESKPERTRVEPEFLDLDAITNEEAPPTPRQQYHVPRALRKSGSKATLMQDSLPSPPPSRDSSIEREPKLEVNEQDVRADEALRALGAQVHVPEVDYHHDVTLDMEGYKSGYHNHAKAEKEHSTLPRKKPSAPDRLIATKRSNQGALTDEATAQGPIPEVEYHNDDMGEEQPGNHGRERSDQTIREQFAFPHREASNQQSSPILPHTQSAHHSSHPSPSPDSPEASPSTSPPLSPVPTHPYPFRATSEPPPDIDTNIDPGQIIAFPSTQQPGHVQPPRLQVPVEYSWEWGAFPQPSPMKTSFGKGGRIEKPKGLWASGNLDGSVANGVGNRRNTLSERKGRLAAMRLPSDDVPSVADILKSDEEEYKSEQQAMLSASGSGLVGRSRSVPAHFLGSPVRKGRKGSREYREYEDVGEEAHDEEDEQEHEERGRGRSRIGGDEAEEKAEIKLHEADNEGFGAGGVLSASRDDLTTFVLSIEGRKMAFQLSLIPTEGENQLRTDKSKTPLRDEMEMARLFDNYCIDWSRFLDDEALVYDPRLVIRWAKNQYITRNDGSPLMDALVRWRLSAIEKRASGEVLRPVSPPPTNDEFDRLDDQLHASQKLHERSKSDIADQRAGGKEGQLPAKKPTSSSWVAWWSRSRRKESTGEAGQQQYSMYDSKSKHNSSASLPLPHTDKASLDEKTKNIPTAGTKTGSAPTTPVQQPADAITPSKAQDTTPTRSTTVPAVAVPSPQKRFAKTLRLTSDQLKSLNLKPGPNSITFSLSASGAVAATARIFVWDSTDLVVISDIDGTITKSDGLGHVFAMIGRDWTHLGVAKLYTDIVKNGYKIMYLTSRAIGQADATRDYLKGIKQNNYQLPEGPVIMSPDRLMASLHREVIMRKPEVFKMACLRDIQRLFGESARNPFYAGFGNRITDALSYRSVNVPSARIFTIDSSGEVKMELLELAGYKSSYIHMTDLVDQMFPPIHRKWTPEFTDFNYWKTPMQDFPLPDLSPPSPALSARSDTSNQSTLARLRNFSLGGNASATARQAVTRQSTISHPGDTQNTSGGSPYRNSHLRQLSSFERLSSTLGFMSKVNDENADQRSTSPSSSYVESDDEDEDIEIGVDGRKRSRRRSMTSMPGTLDERHFELDDDEDDERQFVHHDDEDNEDDEYEGEGDEDQLEHDAEGLDEDILAAGEMANVPFL